MGPRNLVSSLPAASLRARRRRRKLVGESEAAAVLELAARVGAMPSGLIRRCSWG